MALLAILIPLILGYLIVSLILSNERTSTIERICLSYPLGMGFVTMQMFILGILRIPFTLLYMSIPFIIEIIVLSLIAYKKKIPIIVFRTDDAQKMDTQKGSPIRYMAVIILSIWIFVKLGSIFFEAYLRPVWAWDAWANWTASAKIFFYSKGLLLDAPPDEFFGKNTVIRIISYPLHNQLMQVWMAIWHGDFDDVVVKLWSPFYLLSMTLYLYLLLKEIPDIVIRLSIIVIFLSSPLMSYHAVEVYSDLLLGSYIFFAVASFINTMRGKFAYIPLMGIFCAISLFTKDEALFFVVPLMLSAIIFLWKCHVKLKDFISLLIPLTYTIPWYVFKISNNLTLGAESISFDIVFHPEVIMGIIWQFLSLSNFNVIFIFFPLLLIISRPQMNFLYLLFPILCYVGFFVAVYALTTYYYEHFNRGTVFFRNVLTYYPTVVLLSSLLIKNLIEHSRMKT